MIFNDIKDILNFRYKKNHKNWQYPDHVDISYLLEFPRVFSLFEFCILENGQIIQNKKGKGVFCNPKKIKLLKSNLCNYKNEILVLAGADTNLSEVFDDLLFIKPFFNKIYYEAKDIKCDWVYSFPAGITQAYILRCGSNRILEIINSKINKQKNVCACFGGKWPELNITIKDRKDLLEFILNNKFVDHFTCDPEIYYKKISEYKFMACPLGKGIQCPKLWESLLVETIPIVTRHPIYEDFQNQGFPIVIVESWKDLKKIDFENVYSNFKINWDEIKKRFLASRFLEGL